MVPYSIQRLKRLKPQVFPHDLVALLNLLRGGKIKPFRCAAMSSDRARQAQELLGKGGVDVLMPHGALQPAT